MRSMAGRPPSKFGGGEVGVVGGSGGDLLSHVLRRSTMGASGFHGRVRNGVGWGTRAIGHQIDAPPHTACGGAGAPPAAARRGADRSAPAVRRRRVMRQVVGMGPSGGILWWSLTGEEVCWAIRTGQLARVATLPLPAYRRGGLPRP